MEKFSNNEEYSLSDGRVKIPDNGLDKQVRPLKDAYNIFTGMKDHVKGNCTFQYYRIVVFGIKLRSQNFCFRYQLVILVTPPLIIRGKGLMVRILGSG